MSDIDLKQKEELAIRFQTIIETNEVLTNEIIEKLCAIIENIEYYESGVKWMNGGFANFEYNDIDSDNLLISGKLEVGVQAGGDDDYYKTYPNIEYDFSKWLKEILDNL
jgi:hypothetical protein